MPRFLLNICNFIAILLTLPFCWFSPALTAQILDDGFTDGGRANGADALDTNWYRASDWTVLSVVSDSGTPGIGTGNALQLDGQGGAWKVMVGDLPAPITLADGEDIVMSFDFRWTGTTNLNTDGRLRFGIYNSNGTNITADTSGFAAGSICANDVGYYGTTNPGLAGTQTSLYRKIAGNGILHGATTFGTAGQSFNLGTSKGSVVYTIGRVGNTLNFTLSVNGGTVASGTDASPLTYTFNEVAFSNGGGNPPATVRFDSIRVEHVQSTSLVNDGFTDGGRTNGTDSLDAAWYILGAAHSLAVADDAAGIGSGNALKLHSSGTFQGMQGNTPWVHLADGDTLTFSFDWRFAGASGLNEARKLRFGICSSGGTVANGDNIWGRYDNDPGYFAATNPGLASTSGTSLFRETTGDSILSGPNFTGFGSEGTSINGGTTKHSAKITISRSGTSLVFSTSIDGQTAATGTDTSPVTYVFDEIGVRLGGSSVPSQFLIDSVEFTHTEASPVYPEGPPAGNWNLVLDEQFNGTSLNTAVWTTGYRWAPVINNELQAMRPENVTVGNGVCTIEVEKRTAKNRNWVGYEGQTMSYASGAITTYNKWKTTYGYFEARLKMPASKGTWPAFWLLPDRGANYDDYYRTAVGNTVWYPNSTTAPCPMGNEIDIFEHMGTWKNATTGFSKLHTNLHWGYPGSTGGYVNRTGVTGNYVLQNPDTEFHNYGLYWAPGKVVFYIDGEVVMRRDHPNVGVCPHYVLLNCALTTNDWTGTPVPIADIDASLPSNMVIDYVRVYSGTPSPAP